MQTPIQRIKININDKISSTKNEKETAKTQKDEANKFGTIIEFEPSIEPSKAPSIIESDEEVKEEFNINDYINNPDKIQEELQRLGLSEETANKYAGKVKVIDNNHISIEFDNGVNCTYRVNKDGELTIESAYAYAKDDNGNYIYDENGEHILSYESKNNISSYYNNDGSINEQRIFNDNNQIETVLNYKDGEAILITNYAYENDGTLSTIKEQDIINNTTTNYYYAGEKGREYKTFAELKDENDTVIKTWTWDYENSQVIIKNILTGETEIQYYENKELINVEKRDKDGNIIKEGYDITPRTALEYDDYYYPTSPNSINPTNDIGSCVWYVVGRINEVRDEQGIEGVWNYHGYGSEWYYDNPSAYGSSSNINDIKAGAVLSYSPNHVVYVESVNGDGTANISETNVGTPNTAGFSYRENVSLYELESLYGHTLQGMVFTLP